jgi:2-polyprenyl-3-methyl-5-hydroxy-6-metoxy-1,4-benzoquinol methylase
MESSQTARFIVRRECVSCRSGNLIELSAGRFDAGLVAQFIDQDPWGESPAPFLHGHTWSYVRCGECGLAFHRHILAPEWNERRFSKWMSQEAITAFEARTRTPTYEFERAGHFVEHILQIELLTRSLRASNPLRLLDFGCGYGDFLAMCSMFGIEAYGVDRSAAKRDNNRFVNVFAEIEEVADKAPFHALTLYQVLEHLDDPRDLLLKLHGLLARNGILVLETPDCSGITDIRTRDDYYRIHPLEHINGFTAGTMKDFAARLGFEFIAKPVASVTANPVKALKSVAKRLLRPVLQPSTQLYFRKT